jgi:sec-independent protein translocase protein TatA
MLVGGPTGTAGSSPQDLDHRMRRATDMSALAVTMPGGTELIIILFIVLLLFGARRLPDLAASLGRSLREFRRVTHEDADGQDGDEGSSDGGDGRA